MRHTRNTSHNETLLRYARAIAGVPIEHMAVALGHSTAYMTQKYTHIQDEVANEVTDSFLRAIN